jgi:outer membrane protein assembly factor BamB
MMKKNKKYGIISLIFLLSLHLYAGGVLKQPGLTVYIGEPKISVNKYPKNQLNHILLKNSKALNEFNRKISAAGVSGNISGSSVSSFKTLPYPDNFVNTIIITGDSKFTENEILRVLAPNGRVRFPDGRVVIKKRSSKMDDWPQWQHGSDNVVVSTDKLVGPPRHLQWKQDPPWGRMHNDLQVPAPVSSVLTANGRIFYDADTGRPESTDLPYHFFLYARDAYNGILQWKRVLPDWYKGEEYRRGNPSIVVQRRMACADNFLYLTESDEAPVIKLDAATGKVLKVYKGTENAMEIVPEGRYIYVVSLKRYDDKEFIGYSQMHGCNSTWIPPETPKSKLPKGRVIKNYIYKKVITSIIKVDADSGNIIWKKTGGDVSPVFPLTLAVDKNGVFFKTPEYLVKLDAKNGNTLWKTPIGLPLSEYMAISSKKSVNWVRFMLTTRPSPWYLNIQFVGKCILYNDIVLTTTNDRLYAVSKKDGKELWNCPAREGFFLPADIIPIGDLVYIGSKLGEKGFTPVNVKTGKKTKEINLSMGGMLHHRCYRRIATTDALLTSKAGIEFYNLKTGEFDHNQWTRGSCLSGFIPGNGLLYVTPHPCACFTRVKMNGMLAYAPDRTSTVKGTPLTKRLEKGVAYNGSYKFSKPGLSDWAEFRHDSERSGAALDKVEPKLKEAWKVKIGGKLSPVSISGNALYVAAVEKHELYSINKNTGKILWRYKTSGRIDSPPAIRGDYIVFGCRDGWIYCLNKAGKLIWRFHGSPLQRFVGVFEQLESAWPVHGAIVIGQNKNINKGKPVVYINAGRNSYLDSGIYLCGLDLKTGTLLYENLLNGTLDKKGNPVVAKQWEIKGTKNDVLLSDGKKLYIKDYTYSLDCKKDTGKGEPHLVATGLSILDDYRHHRSLWIIGCDTPYFPTYNYAGELMSFVGDEIFSFRGQNGSRNGGNRAMSPYNVGRFTLDKSQFLNQDYSSAKQFMASGKRKWSQRTFLVCDAMTLTGGADLPNAVLFLAGAMNPKSPEQLDKVLNSKKISSLQAWSAADGKVLAEYKLPAKVVYDGMAAAGDSLFMALENGEVMCMKSEK